LVSSLLKLVSFLSSLSCIEFCEVLFILSGVKRLYGWACAIFMNMLNISILERTLKCLERPIGDKTGRVPSDLAFYGFPMFEKQKLGSAKVLAMNSLRF